MLQTINRYFNLPGLKLVLFFLALILAFIIGGSLTSALGQKSRPVSVDAQAEAKLTNEPLFHEYKGIQIGMSADEVRKKLGVATDTSDTQDFYVFSEKESAQIFYDAAKKVRAISVNYLGEGSGAPECKAIVAVDGEVKQDGSIYKLVRYPKYGYWIAFNRTAGAEPIITVTIQKDR